MQCNKWIKLRRNILNNTRNRIILSAARASNKTLNRTVIASDWSIHDFMFTFPQHRRYIGLNVMAIHCELALITWNYDYFSFDCAVCVNQNVVGFQCCTGGRCHSSFEWIVIIFEFHSRGHHFCESNGIDNYSFAFCRHPNDAFVRTSYLTQDVKMSKDSSWRSWCRLGFLCECFDIRRHNVQCTCQSMSPESSISQLTCGTRIACITTLTNRKHHRQHSISLKIDSWTTVDVLYYVVIFVHDTINKLNEFTGDSIVTDRPFQRQQKK